MRLLRCTLLLCCWIAPTVAACAAAKSDDSAVTPAITDDSGTSGDDATPPISTNGLELTKGLPIAEIAIFQGPKVAVMRDFAKVGSRSAPVVSGRPGMLRVYVTPDADFGSREVVATLTLVTGGATKTLTEKKTIGAASSDADLASTFNFPLALDAVTVDSTYSVSLKTAPGQAAAGASDKALYPAGGTPEALDAKSTGQVLTVMIAPVRYDADGSGRLPDTSEAQLERYRKRFQQLYPARSVEISVRSQPIPWATTIGPTDANAFSALLNKMIQTRQADGAPKGTYYFGAFAPGASFALWCGGGCLAGLSPLATRESDTWSAASVGLGFTGDESTGVATHEVGHGHGRKHAPCQVQDADSAYPTGTAYSGAKIGPWSWDVENKALKNPAPTSTRDVPKDFMGYCKPEWVSDYTFGALATRMAYVYAGAYEFRAPATTYQLVSVDAGGALHWGESVFTDAPSYGEEHEVRLELDTGATSLVEGHYYPYDHIPGGLLVVPVGTVKYRRLAVRDLVPGVVSSLARLPAH